MGRGTLLKLEHEAQLHSGTACSLLGWWLLLPSEYFQLSKEESNVIDQSGPMNGSFFLFYLDSSRHHVVNKHVFFSVTFLVHSPSLKYLASAKCFCCFPASIFACGSVLCSVAADLILNYPFVPGPHTGIQGLESGYPLSNVFLWCCRAVERNRTNLQKCSSKPSHLSLHFKQAAPAPNSWPRVIWKQRAWLQGISHFCFDLLNHREEMPSFFRARRTT